MQTSTTQRGQTAEDIVADWLQGQGFQLLARNYRSRFGEIDLIAAKRGLLLFIEVKARRSAKFGAGAESVTPAKQAKIIRTAQAYLAKYADQNTRMRFDVIELDLSAPKSEPLWYQGAFDAS